METELLERTEGPKHDAVTSTLPKAEALPLGRLTSVAAAAALTACGGGEGGAGSADAFVAVPVTGRTVDLSTAGYANTVATTDAEASRFLQQAQFAATDADIASVRSLGYATWLERQIGISWTTGWDWLNIQGYGDVQSSNNYYDNSYQTDYMIWNQLMTAPDPFRKRAALALSEFFVVSLNGVSATWVSHIMAHYWDTLCRHALGNYRDLLEAMTLNVGMGYYLNTKGNLKEDTRPGRLRQPDENYAREVMQLFSLGLVLLNQNGTSQLDSSNNPIDTYSSDDVSNLARVFTGYDLDQSQNVNTTVGTRTVGSTHFARLPMKVDASKHSTLDVELFKGKPYGVTILGSATPSAALKAALDALFNHPNTAPFFCKQMIQRLVTSNPTDAYVERVANVFNGSRTSGVRGDLAQVFAAVLLDNEARGTVGLTAPEFGKLREPMVRLVQWVRTFGVTSANGAWKIGDMSDPGSRLGQSPLRSPSVFNFFRPGYVLPGTTVAAGKVTPEFQLVNESSVGGYLNFMMGVISNGVGNTASDAKAIYTAEIALAVSPSAASPSALVSRLNILLCAGQLSTNTVNTITAAVGTMSSTSADNKRNRVCATVLLIMASAEYLIQK